MIIIQTIAVSWHVTSSPKTTRLKLYQLSQSQLLEVPLSWLFTSDVRVQLTYFFYRQNLTHIPPPVSYRRVPKIWSVFSSGGHLRWPIGLVSNSSSLILGVLRMLKLGLLILHLKYKIWHSKQKGEIWPLKNDLWHEPHFSTALLLHPPLRFC